MGPYSILALLGNTGWQSRKSEFEENGVGIDPAGCGCTDCLVGNSYPEDAIDAAVILEAMAFNLPIYDRR